MAKTPTGTTRMAVVLPNLQGGGCERMAAAVLQALAERFEVHLVLHEDKVCYPLPANVTRHSLELDTDSGHTLPYKIVRFGRRIWRLRAQLRRLHCDLVLSFIDLNNVVTFAAHRLGAARAPFLAVEQTLCPGFFRYNPHARRWSRLIRALLRATYRRADRVVVLSQAMREYMTTELGLSRELDVIHNGIDTAEFHPAPKRGRGPDFEALPACFRQASLRLVNAGRLEQCQKNQAFLLEQFPAIRRRCPEAHLFLIGTGTDEAVLRRRADAPDLAGTVHLLGWQPDLGVYLRHAHALLHTARYETFGNVLMEALASGTPVVVTNSDPVVPEILNNGHYGALVPCAAGPAFVEATVQTLERLAAEPGRADALAAYAHGRFDIRRSAAAYVELVTQELRSSPDPGPAESCHQ